jgi:2-polyprenyl-3-methyl-5-hydroxy-6-metoxy-1,4-benzoquinol methylase
MQTYHGKLRLEILPLIPDGINNLLDIGCGYGITAEYIKKNNYAKNVEGVEFNPEALKIAQTKLDSVFKVDLNQGNNPLADITGKYDCILLLDILEHLIDPKKILDSCKAILNDPGYVIISLPNIRHYTVLMPLIFKNNWEYSEEGILDKTHLRFFTLNSATKLIESAGFKVTTFSKNHSYYRGFKILNLLLLGLLTPFSVSQLIFKCVKT